jgi:hypothetical protein
MEHSFHLPLFIFFFDTVHKINSTTSPRKKILGWYFAIHVLLENYNLIGSQMLSIFTKISTYLNEI